MRSPVKTLFGTAAAFALCVSPAIAAAATSTAVQPASPLVAVSVFGTQASAQIVCSQGAAAAGAAAAWGGAGTSKTARQMELRARTPPAWSLRGSTRKTVLQLVH